MRWPSLSPLRLVAVAALVTGPPAAARAPYAEGEEIQITGTVVDAAGRPAPGTTVRLEASRVEWSFGAINFQDRGRVTVDGVSRETQADDAGQFVIEWTWHDYYNRFALAAGVTVTGPGGRGFRELTRVDLGRRIVEGSPVVTTLAIADGTAVAVAVADRFAAALDTDDERRVYEQLGQPERIETFDRPDYQEVTWWYFQLGKAYRFQDGRLVQVVPFDPVEPF
ncbi:MAG: carboxypeptidase-like regulatory domain-containing protein [Thermoanaerobaculia bacterium]